MTTKLWETDHPYYCSEGNYYNNGLHDTHETWADYIAEWAHYDIDMNMIFRWDWYTPDPADYECELEEDPGFQLPQPTITIHRVLQRKAILRSDSITITEADEPAIRAYLEPYAQRMKEIWEPLL